jgi:hypothetical protein
MCVTSSKPYFLGVRPVRVFLEFEVAVPRPRPDPVCCGLCFDGWPLVVLDGAKAFPAARAVFGAKSLIPRRTLHQRRNMADQLPAKGQVCVDAKLGRAFGHPDPEQRLRNAPRGPIVSIGRATHGSVTPAIPPHQGLPADAAARRGSAPPRAPRNHQRHPPGSAAP